MLDRTLYFVIPGDIDTRTGGYRYDKRIIEELIQLDCRVELIALQGDYPFPTAAQLNDALLTIVGVPDDSLVVMDGLAFSTMPEIIQAQSHRLEITALIHHPLALETGLTPAQQETLMHRETQCLSYAERVITTSRNTAELLRNYQVASDRIFPVLPGTDRGNVAEGSSTNTVNLFCVATLTPRKGHAVLLKALQSLRQYPWHLYCAGNKDRDAQTTHDLIQQISADGLDDRVSLLGELDDEQLSAWYQCSDLFVLASFHEGYGMVLDEAIAHGLPIVCTNGGAMKDTVPAGAGLLVPVDDPIALSQAIEKFLTDNDVRRALTNQALIAREQLRSWASAATEFADTLVR